MRIPELDGLRGIAILAVLAVHTAPARVPGGFLGVDLFFVLSGFLITTLLIEGEYQAIAEFYRRRALRILPPLALAIGLAVALGSARHLLPPIAFYANLVDERALGSLAPTWSLAVEEHFYIAWPLLALAGARLRFLAVACAIAIALRVGLDLAGVDPVFIYRFTLARVDAIAVGCGAAILFHRRAAAIPRWLAIACAGAVLSGFAFLSEWTGMLWLMLGSFAFAVACAAVILSARDGSLPWLAHPVLRYIGTRSYAVYLFHLPIFMALHEPAAALGLGAYAEAAVKIAATFALAELSYRTVERFARSMRARVGRQQAIVPAE